MPKLERLSAKAPRRCERLPRTQQGTRGLMRLSAPVPGAGKSRYAVAAILVQRIRASRAHERRIFTQPPTSSFLAKQPFDVG